MHAFNKLDVPENSLGIHWFGQNSFALKDSVGTVILIDPHFRRDRSPEEFIHPFSPLDESELKTDLVLLTHEHGDHTCLESLQRIYAAHPNARYYGPAESIDHLRKLRIKDDLLLVVTAGDVFLAGSAKICAVYSKPPKGVPEEGIPIPDVEHLGYVIEFGGVRVYVSGDPINTLSKHDELLMPIIQCKPDIGFITTHPTEGEFPYFEGSIELASKLGLKTVVPAHYDCYVQRTFDPYVWAACFPEDGPRPCVIGYDESIVYRPT